MPEKMYLHLLILCVILCQFISASLLDEDYRNSSDFLVRKTRVVNNLPGGERATPIQEANYLVGIKENAHVKCAGLILSHYTVITVASCFVLDISRYTVLSGSNKPTNKTSTVHYITSKVEYYGKEPIQSVDGIALITITDTFQFSKTTGYIGLHEGYLQAGTLVTVKGWGCSYLLQSKAPLRRIVRTITLPILNHRECQNEYRYHHGRLQLTEIIHISDKHLCTYDPHQYCARHDVGAPLIFNNKLAGLHVWKGQFLGSRNPDVYIDVSRPDYTEWIRRHSILM